MRYESLADMPQGMRFRVAKKIIRKNILDVTARDNNGHVQVDGIWFQDEKLASRYKLLVRACWDGMITDLHVRENLTLADSMVLPGGEKRNQVRMQADFSYIPTGRIEFGYPEFDIWEEIAQTCPGMRVFELMHRPNQDAERLAKAKGYILLEVPTL